MSHDERVETLPDFIKTLAQQVVTRDSQLKSEQARFDEELASMRHRAEEMRSERDRALRSAEELTAQVEAIRMEWKLDVERTRMQDERALAKENALVVEVKAGLELERAESKRKIEFLEQAIAHEAGLLAQTRREVDDWKTRYTVLCEKSQHHMEDWKAQFTQVTAKLDELFTVSRLSGSGSSPTVVSSPTNDPSADKVSNPEPRRQVHVEVPPRTTNSNSAPTTNGSTTHVPQTGSVSQNVVVTPVKPSGNGGRPISSRPSQTHGMTRDSSSPQRQARVNKEEFHPAQLPPKTSSSQSALPPDRVIITAHYEIKKEDDDESSDLDYPLTYPEVSGSGSSRPRAMEEDRDSNGEPVAKRRKTARRHSARRIVHDEEGAQEQQESDHSGQGDFDEMAIGAEFNHREVYGYRRVNVREVNARPRTPPHRSQAQSIGHSGGSSGKKRKVGAITTPNGRPVTAKAKR